MKVFYDGETIINVEDGCPSIARLTEQGAEELPSSLFDGLEQFANSTNTTKANGDWEFDASEALGRLEETVRVERNCLLEASDKSQLPDLPMTDEKREEWRQYRQELRDVTGQPGFPRTVTWPVEPAAD